MRNIVFKLLICVILLFILSSNRAQNEITVVTLDNPAPGYLLMDSYQPGYIKMIDNSGIVVYKKKIEYKKILIILFVCLLLVGTVSAANYYISTSASGTGSGDSWANKKDFKTLNTASLLPGDIVYIDGGTNGLIYERSPFTIYSRGTSDKYIKFVI